MDNTRKKADRPGKRQNKPGKRQNWMMLIHKQTYITRAHNAGGIVRPLRAPEKTIKNNKKRCVHACARANANWCCAEQAPLGGQHWSRAAAPPRATRRPLLRAPRRGATPPAPRGGRGPPPLPSQRFPLPACQPRRGAISKCAKDGSNRRFQPFF